jgi:hypothetical protein
MSDEFFKHFKSGHGPRLVEYIGPYGSGKTTRLHSDKFKLKESHTSVLDRFDFQRFVKSHSKAKKSWLLISNIPLYFCTITLLLIQSRGAKISDRRRRSHLVAMKALYFRRFLDNPHSIFLSDEGLVHSCCPLFTGSKSGLSSLILWLLYGRLSPLFILIEASQSQCTSNIINRNKSQDRCATARMDDDHKFISIIQSTEPKVVGAIVRDANLFYKKTLPAISKRWQVLAWPSGQEIAG